MIEKCDEEGEDEVLELCGRSMNKSTRLDATYSTMFINPVTCGNKQVLVKNSFSSLSSRSQYK